MANSKWCFGLVLLCMIIAPSDCINNTLESRMTQLEHRFDSMEHRFDTRMTQLEHQFESMEKNIQSVNIAMSKVVSLIDHMDSGDEEDEESRKKREILGNTPIGDITLKQLIDAHRTYGGSGLQAGSSYVRWGRKTCGNSAQMLYPGFAAGQHYKHSGGASNYQCLPLNPEYSKYTSSDSLNWIYGAEYQSQGLIFHKSMHDQNVPCARCYVPTRATTIMIPAKRTCPESWTKEYEGYLMAGKWDHKRAYNYVCMDQQPEKLPGGQGNTDGALFYFVQGACSTLLHCPPYKDGAELSCVVCSK